MPNLMQFYVRNAMLNNGEELFAKPPFWNWVLVPGPLEDSRGMKSPRLLRASSQPHMWRMGSRGFKTAPEGRNRGQGPQGT